MRQSAELVVVNFKRTIPEVKLTRAAVNLYGLFARLRVSEQAISQITGSRARDGV